MHGRGGEIDFMAQPEVKCEFLRYRPLILKVSEQGLLPDSWEGSRQVAPILIGQIKQETGKSIGETRSAPTVQGGRPGTEEKSPTWTVSLSLQQVIFVKAPVDSKFNGVIFENARPVADQVNVRFGANPRQTG